MKLPCPSEIDAPPAPVAPDAPGAPSVLCTPEHLRQRELDFAGEILDLARQTLHRSRARIKPRDLAILAQLAVRLRQHAQDPVEAEPGGASPGEDQFQHALAQVYGSHPQPAHS